MLIGARFFGLVLGSQPSTATLPVEGKDRWTNHQFSGAKMLVSGGVPAISRHKKKSQLKTYMAKFALHGPFSQKKQVGRISFKNWMMFPFLRVFIVLDSGIVHGKMMNSRQEVVLSLHIGHGRTSSLAKQEEPVGRLVDVLYHYDHHA